MGTGWGVLPAGLAGAARVPEGQPVLRVPRGLADTSGWVLPAPHAPVTGVGPASYAFTAAVGARNTGSALSGCHAQTPHRVANRRRQAAQTPTAGGWISGQGGRRWWGAMRPKRRRPAVRSERPGPGGGVQATPVPPGPPSAVAHAAPRKPLELVLSRRGLRDGPGRRPAGSGDAGGAAPRARCPAAGCLLSPLGPCSQSPIGRDTEVRGPHRHRGPGRGLSRRKPLHTRPARGWRAAQRGG